MTEPNDGPQAGLMEHIQRILVHGLGALRCYITMLAAEGERRGRRLLDQAMWVLLLAALGFLGVGLFAFGAAQWIESRLSVPGSGAMIVGMARAGIAHQSRSFRSARERPDARRA